MSTADEVWPAACLLFLFADDAASRPRQGWTRHFFAGEQTVRTPCSGKLVTLASLEQQLLAWTVWELREVGAVDLTRDVGAKRGDRRDGLDISMRVSMSKAVDGILASGLFAACDNDPLAVSLVIIAWGKTQGVNLRELIYLPLTGLVDVVSDETRSRLGVDPSGGEWRWPCDTIALLRTRFDDVRTKWSRFAADESGLAAALLRSCNAGVKRLRQPPGTLDTHPV
jgi:hypothetical protein